MSDVNLKEKKCAKTGWVRRCALGSALFVVILAVSLLCAYAGSGNLPETSEAVMQEAQTQEPETAAEAESETAETAQAEPVAVSTATIGVTGDILIHNPILAAALCEDGTYDFSDMFAAVSSYWSDVDYMIANLEVSLGGEDYGAYSGYPLFNCPDTIVEALAGAGVDMLLTANNHAYDSKDTGLLRTQEVIEEYGLDYAGTRMDTEDSYVLIKEINGITFGFTCFTYETQTSESGIKSINGITMTENTQDLINSFSYTDLDSLYEAAEAQLAEMKDCDVKIVFMHWGSEYAEEPNEYQTEIAQALSNLGADVIIGGHPHVIQAFDILEGEGGNSTYCLYSTGNALSNQRAGNMSAYESRGYTEDGLTIQITYEKLSDGTVSLTEIYILPTWVEKTDGEFSIIPLDYTIDTGLWETSETSSATASYNRTLERIGDAYILLRDSLNLAEIPASLD